MIMTFYEKEKSNLKLLVLSYSRLKVKNAIEIAF